MNAITVKNDKSSVYFYIYFMSYQIITSSGIRSDSLLYKCIEIIGITFLFLKIITTTYERRELASVAILGIISLLVYYTSRKNGFLVTFATIIGLKGIDIHKLLRVTFGVRLVCFIVTIVLSLGNLTSIVHIRNEVSVVRYSLGYIHPNRLHSAFFTLLMLYIYLYWNSLTAKHFIIFFATNFLMYQVSYSRSALIVGTIAILFALLIKYLEVPRLKKFICWVTIPLCASAALFCTIFYYDYEIIRVIDKALQYRILYAHQFLSVFPINMFGNNINEMLSSTVFDLGWSQLFISGGILCSFIFMFLLQKAIYKEIENAPVFVLLIAFTFYGLTEAFFLNILDNVSLLFIACQIFRSSKYKEIISLAY